MQFINKSDQEVIVLIKRFRIDCGQNDYATIIEPDAHEDERKQLIAEGYYPWCRYKIQAEKSEDFGKTEELFVR